jgi:hypothetical protein
VRAPEESAEAIVVRRALETGKERRAEGSRESNRLTILPMRSAKAIETERALQQRQPPFSAPCAGGGGFP